MKLRTQSIIRLSLCFVAAGLILASCTNHDNNYRPSQLVGKWVETVNGSQGTEYYRFDTGDSVMTGVTWDVADDVSEEEGQPFEWTLDKDQLTIVHIMEMGGRIPKVYNVTKLTSSILTIKDNYGQSTDYEKVY